MLGANSDGEPTKKTTELKGNRPFHSQPPRCDGSHRHCILRGHDSGGSRTAQAAVYPKAMCQLILDEVASTSEEIRSGGRTAEVQVAHLRDAAHHKRTLQKLLPELRLLAEHHGDKTLQIFDSLVKPWVVTAMGCELAVLPYDKDLTHLQIITLRQGNKKETSNSNINFINKI